MSAMSLLPHRRSARCFGQSMTTKPSRREPQRYRQCAAARLICRTLTAHPTMSTDGGRRRADAAATAGARWTLTSESFERLLAALDRDRDRAAMAYERLRERTIGLLRWWGAVRPDELADETLDRVARKLMDGAPIVDGSFGAYVRGVARLVFYESGRDRVEPLTGREVAPALRSAEIEAASECLERCLASLIPADRSLLLR